MTTSLFHWSSLKEAKIPELFSQLVLSTRARTIAKPVTDGGKNIRWVWDLTLPSVIDDLHETVRIEQQPATLQLHSTPGQYFHEVYEDVQHQKFLKWSQYPLRQGARI